MKRDDLRPDPDLHAILRQFDANAQATPARRAALAQRIARDADAIFATRHPQPPVWWEFAATWARALVPLGLATAVAAAAVIAWNVVTTPSQVQPLAITDDALVGLAPGTHTSNDLLDLLVSPSALPTPLRTTEVQHPR